MAAFEGRFQKLSRGNQTIDHILKSIFQFSLRSNWAATVGVSSLAGFSMYPHGRSSSLWQR